jgi:hypothetical protein
MVNRKAVVLFPGVRYSVDTPLLYYAGSAFSQRGYEVFSVDYGDKAQSLSGLEATAETLAEPVLAQLRSWGLEGREDVVFVSKSIGTVLAGRCAQELGCPVRHIYLTPLELTLPYLVEGCGIAVGAGADPFLDAERLKAHCAAQGVPLTLFPGVGHRLEDKENLCRTLEILEQVVKLYERF